MRAFIILTLLTLTTTATAEPVSYQFDDIHAGYADFVLDPPYWYTTDGGTPMQAEITADIDVTIDHLARLMTVRELVYQWDATIDLGGNDYLTVNVVTTVEPGNDNKILQGGWPNYQYSTTGENWTRLSSGQLYQNGTLTNWQLPVVSSGRSFKAIKFEGLDHEELLFDLNYPHKPIFQGGHELRFEQYGKVTTAIRLIPEPSALALLCIGAIAIGGIRCWN